MRKLTYIITTATLLFLMAFTSTAGPGGADDPLVSTSFLKTIFTDVFENTLKTKISVSQDKDKTDFEAKLGEYDKKTDALISGESIIKDAVKKSVNEKISQGALGKASVITLDKGERILGGLGTKMVIIDGSAKLFGKQGDVINLTRGGTANVNTVAPKNTNYFFGADKTSGFEAEANGTKILITGNFKKEGMYTPQNTKYADALYKLNLFKGTDNGYDLNKKGDRLQGLILLIRLMGEENEALSHSGKTPFLDLNSWAEGHKYIGYAYDTGITKGTNVENTTFSPTMELSANIYLTFVLRSLGYDDSKGDFHWEESSVKKAIEVGILNSADYENIKTEGFYRDHIVKISYNALNAKLKGTTQTLAQKLIQKGVFTQNQFNAVAQEILTK